MSVFPVVARGEDSGKGADLARPRKEIDPVAYLGLVEAGRILNRYGYVHASGVRPGDILVQAGEVIDPRRGLQGVPLPLQPRPLYARSCDAVLVTPDGKAIWIGGGGIGNGWRL